MQVLITRFFRDRKALQLLIEDKELTFRECPFIDFEYHPPREIPQTEWIFFNSKNGIISLSDHFWTTLSSNYKIGVTGKGTAEKLQEKNIRPDFIGDTSKGTSDVGQHFFSTHRPKSVWFPISNRSNKTIQKQALDKETIIETVSYTTILKATKLQKDYDWYVFTSPSNVESFFSENEIPENASILAMGEQTEKKLKLYTNKPVILPKESSEQGLFMFFYDL